MNSLDDLLNKGEFAGRHLGSGEAAQREMLDTLKVGSLDALVREVVPAGILLKEPLALGEAMREPEALAELSAHAMRNEVWRSFIGMGYHGTHTPAVIQRNVLENPGWYTQYTPYQAEIAQGRLEALLAFQTMVADLTGLPLANASLLDEATAAAEAMAMCHAADKASRKVFFAAADCHPQTLAVVRTRAKSMGIDLVVGKRAEFSSLDLSACSGILLPYSRPLRCQGFVAMRSGLGDTWVRFFIRSSLTGTLCLSRRRARVSIIKV